MLVNIGELECVTFAEAKKIIQENNKPDKKIPYLESEITLKTGKFGPYFVYEGINYSIYKTYDVDNLKEEDITRIIDYKNKNSKKKDSGDKKKKVKEGKKKVSEGKKKKVIKKS